jgi:hypothetical protein
MLKIAFTRLLLARSLTFSVSIPLNLIPGSMILMGLLDINLVEAAGIEPASEDIAAKVSTSLVYILILASAAPIDTVRIGQSAKVSPSQQQTLYKGYPANRRLLEAAGALP